jgi:hypothetical protein
MESHAAAGSAKYTGKGNKRKADSNSNSITTTTKRSKPSSSSSSSEDVHPVYVPGYRSSTTVFLTSLPTDRSQVQHVLHEKQLVEGSKGKGILLVLADGTLAMVPTAKTKFIQKQCDRLEAMLASARSTHSGLAESKALLVLPVDTGICKSKCLARLEGAGIALQRLEVPAVEVAETLRWSANA